MDADRMKASEGEPNVAGEAAALTALRGSATKSDVCCTAKASLTAAGGRLATTMGDPVKPAFTVPLNPPPTYGAWGP